MKRPYIICYMMTSVDGRIDCAMTAQLPGTDEYYELLNELNIPSVLSGRTTAQLEMALPGKFEAHDSSAFGKEGFSKKAEAPGYEIITDSKGALLWDKETDTEKPHLIITSEQVSDAYLQYLDDQNISWIVCGKEKVDVRRASEILYREFHVKRLGLVGGPVINMAFLNADLVDEVDLLIGPGIDGRSEMPSVFEGRKDSRPLPLKLKNIRSYENGAVLLQYTL